MDNKKITKKAAAKKQVKTNVGKKLADATKTAAAKKTAAPTEKKAGAQKTFLFSIPSLHTTGNDYEHLVIAHDAKEAAKLLAESRCTEKWPELTPEQRQVRVNMMTLDYSCRAIAVVEQRKEAPTVVQVNHFKSPTPVAETLTLQ
jgi:hypothetical protein